MGNLSDPRCFNAGAGYNELRERVASAVAAQPVDRAAHAATLRDAVWRLLDAREDGAITLALSAMPDARHGRVLAEALAQALDIAASPSSALVARVFAMPIVIVAAGAPSAEIAGSLPDVDALRALFEEKQVLGSARNFSFANALCSLDALQALPPSAILHAQRALDTSAISDALPPAPIAVPARQEQVHLRFVVGAAISAAHAPSFTETAADIGRWGMACARLLAAQLAVPGVQLLALPRPPGNLIRAASRGRTAQLEVALDLFVSNAVRRLRMSAGDPAALLSTHDNGDLRLTLDTPFADDLHEGFRWPLDALDDLAEVERTIAKLLNDARVGDVRYVPHVLPAWRVNGTPFYPRRSDRFDRQV